MLCDHGLYFVPEVNVKFYTKFYLLSNPNKNPLDITITSGERDTHLLFLLTAYGSPSISTMTLLQIIFCGFIAVPVVCATPSGWPDRCVIHRLGHRGRQQWWLEVQRHVDASVHAAFLSVIFSWRRATPQWQVDLQVWRTTARDSSAAGLTHTSCWHYN